MVSKAKGHFRKWRQSCRFWSRTPPSRERFAMNIQIKPQHAKDAKPLAGKVSLVTGSTSGIGLGIARALAEAGSAVMLNGFGVASEIARTKDQLSADCDVKVSYSPADMTKPAAIREMIETTLAEHGRLDEVANNAGIHDFAPLE